MLDFSFYICYLSSIDSLNLNSKFNIASFFLFLFLLFSKVNYPSALNSFESIIKCARNKKVVIFLDYDGTLSPIVDDPDRAFMSDNVSEHICSLMFINITRTSFDYFRFLFQHISNYEFCF